MGKPIKLHLHHIDGDHTNNEFDNLQILCPNCHAQTDNYGVYNSKKYKEGVHCSSCGKAIKKNKTGLCQSCYFEYRKNNSKHTHTSKNKSKHKSKPMPKILCPCCKTNLMNHYSKKCSQCAGHNKLINLPDTEFNRDILKTLIRDKSFIQIGKQFNVSNKAIVKMCQKYNLPFRKKDIKTYSDKEWEKV